MCKKILVTTKNEQKKLYTGRQLMSGLLNFVYWALCAFTHLPLTSMIIVSFRFGWRGQSRDSIGTVLCVDPEDGILRVGFPGASRGWKADPAEMERVEEFKVGDWVRVRPTLTTSKHGLGNVVPGTIGIVYCIRPDSSLLVELSYVQNPWHCEPEEIEHVPPFRVRGM